jgi:putative DNA methylase
MIKHPNVLTDASKLTSTNSEEVTLLDAGLLPVEDLAKLAQREGRRPRPIYQVHRWFARRFGSAFRALLTAAALPAEADFWSAYYKGTDWSGRTILDPFVGGGTSVVEALRLGADVIGIDVDAVACAITHVETRANYIPDLLSTLETLKSSIGEQLAPYYQTVTTENERRTVLHYFWVQVIDCYQCGQRIEAHPHHQLAYESEGTHQWAFCPHCYNIQTLDRSDAELHCKQCDLTVLIQDGTVHRGRLVCPHCKGEERLIDVAARMGGPPSWRLFALEVLEPSNSRTVQMRQRHFQAATAYDQVVLEDARRALRARSKPDSGLLWIPERLIPREGRADNRLPTYGYNRYHELFNDRQLLHLSYLAEAINCLKGPVREAMTIAFSDHLTTNCMMTHYAFGWRRLAPLFSIRAYRHMTRPVEINPWLDGTGRGTFPNGVRQVQRAIAWAQSPKEALIEGGFLSTPVNNTSKTPQAKILHRNSQRLDFLPDGSIDLVLTDPPYFDNIAYSELSDFFLPWLQILDLVPLEDASALGLYENLAVKGKDTDAALKFQQALHSCFLEISRVLKPSGRLVFTYQHHRAIAWQSLASALACTGLRPIQLFPMLGDSNTGLHKHQGTSTWDAVFVVVKDQDLFTSSEPMLSEAQLDAARRHYMTWVERLAREATLSFRDADRQTFYRACLVAATCNLFINTADGEPRLPLSKLLQNPFPQALARS